MAWFATFHATWSEVAVAVMAVSGAGMARDVRRRRRAVRRHPAGRPFDWARDVPQLRQAVTVRRRAS